MQHSAVSDLFAQVCWNILVRYCNLPVYTFWLLSFQRHSERCFLLGILFLIKISCSRNDHHILPETIHIFFLYGLFSNTYSKFKFMAKNFRDLCNFSKKIFFTILYWCLITGIDVSWQYCENFRKSEQMELTENLRLVYLPYWFQHNLQHFFTMEEKWK